MTSSSLRGFAAALRQIVRAMMVPCPAAREYSLLSLPGAEPAWWGLISHHPLDTASAQTLSLIGGTGSSVSGCPRQFPGTLCPGSPGCKGGVTDLLSRFWSLPWGLWSLTLQILCWWLRCVYQHGGTGVQAGVTLASPVPGSEVTVPYFPMA